MIRTPVKRLMLGVLLLIAIATTWWLANSTQPDITIEFVLPADMRGLFFAREDPTADAPEVKGTTYTYTVPSNGVLLSKDMSPIQKWHRITARTNTGTAIRTINSGHNSKEDIVLRELGNLDNTSVFVIGTFSEYEFYENMAHTNPSKLETLPAPR